MLTGGVAASYTLAQDWGTGFQGQIQLTNSQATSVANWQLQFDFARNLTSIWDASIVSHVGNHYVVAGDSWDSALPAGGAVSFGFIGAGSGSGTAPANFLLNSIALGPQPTALPALSVADVSQNDSPTGVTNFVFGVTLSAASSSAVSVAFATGNGTALAGTDYQTTSGTLTFPPGATQEQITVPVLGSMSAAPNKTFSLTLSSPAGATLARSVATGTIFIPGAPATSGNFQFQDTSDWGSGFSGQITMTNTAEQPVNNWRVEFDFAAQITSIWDASIVSHVGNHYIVQNAGWNGTIAPGGTASFGFNGSPGNLTTQPLNYRLYDGNATYSGATNHAPTPAGDTVLVNPGQPIAINVLANDTDPDGDPLSVTSITQPKDGVAVLNADGTITYTPATGFIGSDAFSYSVKDGRGGVGSATVSLTVGTPAATASWPAQFFAPYVDVTLYPAFNLVSATQTQGVKFFTLAFITADSSDKPAWGGYSSYEVNGGAFDMALRQQVAAVRTAGGDVMASFGGAAGQELAQVITSVPQLTAAYQTVVTDYNLTHLDFDIEGAAEADHASIDRRSEALAALQQAQTAAGHPLQIWYTLPVLPSGLTADGLYVLQSALRYGVQIAGVNVMAMDYGDSAAPNPSGQMGQFAIEAAQSTFAQLQTLYGSTKTSAQLWQMIGVTPMIGLNDDTSEVFDEAAARQLVAFAQQQGMGRISMWSLNRDTTGTATNSVTNTASSITQQAFDFSHIFEAI